MLEPTNIPPCFIRAPFPLPSPAEGQSDVIRAPGVLSSQEGIPIKLEVQVHGVPEPNVSWFLNDHPVRHDFKHKVIRQEAI